MSSWVESFGLGFWGIGSFLTVIFFLASLDLLLSATPGITHSSKGCEIPSWKARWLFRYHARKMGVVWLREEELEQVVGWWTGPSPSCNAGVANETKKADGFG
jgi:hypothetical protein